MGAGLLVFVLRMLGPLFYPFVYLIQECALDKPFGFEVHFLHFVLLYFFFCSTLVSKYSLIANTVSIALDEKKNCSVLIQNWNCYLFGNEWFRLVIISLIETKTSFHYVSLRDKGKKLIRTCTVGRL